MFSCVLAIAGCASLPRENPDFVPPPSSIADGSAERYAMNARVHDAAIAEVERRFYARDFNGLDFRGEAAARRAGTVGQRDEQSFYRALNETLDLLDDDHTHAISPSVHRDQQARRVRGGPTFGLVLFNGTTEDGESRRYVLQVMPDSPGAEAGVQPGWRILSINGGPWPGPTLAPEPDHLRFVDREGQEHERHMVARHMPRQIGMAERRPDGILVLSFFDFDAVTVEWLRDRFAEISDDPPTGIVIDLRANRGGTVDATGRILGHFFDDRVGFARVNLGLLKRIPLFTRPATHRWSGPVTVMQGPSSYSGAEVFAAAIQEHGRGLVVGQQSAGAVVLGNGFQLPDGGILNIGVSDFLTLSETRLEKVGVTPDVVVQITEEDVISGRDPVMEAAVRSLLERGPDRLPSPSIARR